LGNAIVHRLQALVHLLEQQLPASVSSMPR
jgi:hypothetical protein